MSTVHVASRRQRRSSVGALAAALALIVSACSGSASQAPTSQAPASQAPASQAPASQAPASEAPASQAQAPTGTITIASVANGDLQTMASLKGEFERTHPGITVNFLILPENDIRAKVTTDVATGAGTFDLVTVGMYEVPLWAKQGWIEEVGPTLAADPHYNLADIFKPTLDGLSYNGKLYAAPLSSQASMTFYRKDLLDAAGVTMPEHPTWDEIIAIAQKVQAPGKGIYGMCLRGLPGWGQMGAPLGTVINTFGGRWYDANWKAQITSPETSAAIKFYIDAVKKYVAPGATQAGNNECGTTMALGQAAIMYDDSSWTQFLFDPKTDPYAKDMSVAFAPVKTAGSKLSGWSWSWAFAMESTSKNKAAAYEFMKWATGPDYIPYAQPLQGWGKMPPPARKTMFSDPSYLKFGTAFLPVLQETLQGIDPTHATVYADTPYTGIQYVQIPEFQDLGNKCTQEFSGAIVGSQTPDQAIAKCQQYAEDVAVTGGYAK